MTGAAEAGSGAAGGQPAIVGVGRVGSVLARCLPGAARLGRGAAVTDLPEAGAAWLCMPNEGATGWLAALGAQRGAMRAICTQNGFFTIPPGATRALIYFAATDRSGACVVGGATLLHGARAAEGAAALQAGGIAAEVVADPVGFAREVAIKTGWCHALGLIGERLGLPVGAAAARPELEQIAAEIAPALSDLAGAPLGGGELIARWRAYSASIPGYPARLRDRPWRTDPILARARALGTATPLHDAWLAA